MQLTTAAVLAVAVGAGLRPSAGAAQQPRPADPRPIGDVPVPTNVRIPSALPRSELDKRLRRLGASLPTALAPGASIILSPARLTDRQTTLKLSRPLWVAPIGGSPIASFTADRFSNVEVGFTAVAGAQYALIVTVLPRAATRYEGIVWHPAPVGSPVDAEGEHVVHLFTAARAGPFRAGLRSTNATWMLVQVELLRLR
jgi:hypothetical protein